MLRLRADEIQEMLVTIQFGIIYVPVSYLQVTKPKD